MEPVDRRKIDKPDVAETNGPEDGVTHGAPTLVIVPILSGRRAAQGAAPRRTPEARLEEAVGLAAAIALDIKHSSVVRLNDRRPATLFGTGKVEELGVLVKTEEVELVVVDHVLTPFSNAIWSGRGTRRFSTGPGLFWKFSASGHARRKGGFRWNWRI